MRSFFYASDEVVGLCGPSLCCGCDFLDDAALVDILSFPLHEFLDFLPVFRVEGMPSLAVREMVVSSILRATMVATPLWV